MADVIDLTLMVAEEPKRVFNAWMDPREHAQFTGGGIATIEPWSGGRFTAFDGNVHGIFLGVDPAARIVQTFRTPEFPPEARDSRVTVTFEASGGGTKVHILHSDVPPNLLRKLQKVWEGSYLKRLAKYFIDAPRKKGADKAAAKAAAGKLAEAKAPAGKAAEGKAPAQGPAKGAPAKAEKVKGAPAGKSAAPTKRAAPAPAARPAAPAKAAPPAKRSAPAKSATPAKRVPPAKRSAKGKVAGGAAGGAKRTAKKAVKSVKSRGQKRSSRA
jgi:uncharacterized protein YndB with AHSA1/START domain